MTKNTGSQQTRGDNGYSIKLYHYWRSSASWRVRWALAHKGLNCEKVAINLLKGEQHAPEYRRINPAGQVPAMAVGGHVFTESLAILEYLEEQYPHRPLLPVNPLGRMTVRQLSLVIVAGTQPLQNLTPQARHSSDPVEQKEFAKFFVKRGLTAFEDMVRATAGTFCYGSELSFADLCLIPQVYNAIRYNLPLYDWPTAQRIYDTCRALASCQEADPEHQPDAVPT